MLGRRYHDLRALLADARGVSAVEFGLLAPILVVSFIAMVDIGMAVTERMAMDRSVRAGAQAAMALINDPAIIQGVVEEAAGEIEDVAVNVAVNCSCGGTASACTALCGSGEEPSVFLDIDANKTYSGVLLSTIPLGSQTSVQVR